MSIEISQLVITTKQEFFIGYYISAYVTFIEYEQSRKFTSRRAINEDAIVFKYKNSKFDSSVNYFRSVDSKIPFTNAARAPLMNN